MKFFDLFNAEDFPSKHGIPTLPSDIKRYICDIANSKFNNWLAMNGFITECDHKPEDITYYDEYLQGSFNMAWWQCKCGAKVKPIKYEVINDPS